MGFRRIRLDVGEIQVERLEDSTLSLPANEDNRIVSSRKVFVGNCVCLESCASEDGRVFGWEIFVDLEIQALVSRGRSTVPSRVSSAAYARAASMSAFVSGG